MHLSREFNLAVECCRRGFRGGPQATGLPVDGVDWDRLVRLVQFHRVEGLAWSALAQTKVSDRDGVVAALAADAAAIAAKNLRASLECGELLGAFTAAGMPVLFLKGLPLGALVYRSPSLKAAVDIDLLIDPRQIESAAELLRGRGYDLLEPATNTTSSGLRAWHANRKDSEWAKRSSTVRLDLHTRLADNPKILGNVTANSPAQWVEIAKDIKVPALAPDELFAHLAVHGASSAWFRLKWLSDFAALAATLSEDQLERRYRASEALGVGRAAAQGLLLADQLFGALEKAPSLRRAIADNSTAKWLARLALRRLASDESNPVEPTARPWGTMTMHLMQFMLIPGAAYKASELSRQIRAALR